MTGPIRINTDRNIGPLFRRMRIAAGLTQAQLGRLTHVTKKAICARELHATAVTAGALIDTASALGYEVLLVPYGPAPRRFTGTGWPA